MANGRNPKRRGRDTSRDSGGFMAIPWSVLDCPAYARLSHPARSLLLEIARQFVRDNNGRLLASLRHLESRGWKSWDVITRAKRELLESGFIHETVMGHRPNKASWYALTWRALDKIPGFDPGAEASFERGAYMKKIDVLTPSHGAGRPAIAPSHGDHLEKPSTAVCLSAGIPDSRLPASLALIGRILHRARPANRPAGYALARSRFPLGVNHD